MAAYVELFMDQGTTFNNIINLSDDLTNANINISGYVIRSQMRRSYYSANASANITCTITDAINGEITMNLPANTTANIKAGRYLFDLETVSTSGVTSRVLEGIITVTPEITR
jgi:hypothetical protein